MGAGKPEEQPLAFGRLSLSTPRSAAVAECPQSVRSLPEHAGRTPGVTGAFGGGAS